MGSITIQDTALSVPILLEILNDYEVAFGRRDTTSARKRDILMMSSYLVIGFVERWEATSRFCWRLLLFANIQQVEGSIQTSL
jgi:hypothetical protein